MLPPALIDAGGIVLGSVTSAEFKQVRDRAGTKLYATVAADIQQKVQLDA